MTCRKFRVLARRAGADRGLSLLDVICALAIVAVLVGLAMPSYRQHTLRASRTEARAALLALATAQERFFVLCERYATSLDPSGPGDCERRALGTVTGPALSGYAIGLAEAGSGWVATATAARDGTQWDDEGCRVLELSSEGHRTALTAAGLRNDLECWNR